jgi:tRNA A37 threonylcarbamoyladenosine modification protein TsaB
MLGAVLQVPVHGVCTLDALALEAGIGGPFRVATDARRKEVYWAAYDGSGTLSRLDGPHVSRPAEVPGDGPVVGPAPQLYPEAFPDGREPLRPSAAALCRWVAEGHPTMGPAPLYLRRPDATEPAPRKPVLG